MKFACSFFFMLFLTQAAFAQTAADEQAIRQLVQTMAEGWSEGSGEKFASAFADRHDYIVWNGMYFKGMTRPGNAAAHQGLLQSIYKDTDHHATVDQIQFVREDLALIHVFAAIVPRGEGRPKDPQVLWTGLLEKQQGDWKILSFHNLDLEVFQDEQTRAQAPMPPEVMYAGWYAAAEQK